MSKLVYLKRKFKNPRKNLTIFILFVVALGFVFSLFFHGFDPGSLSRWYHYRFLNTRFDEDALFPHNAGGDDLFLNLERNLLVCTRDNLQIFSAIGTPRMEKAVSMRDPAFSVSGSKTVIYDLGGQEVDVLEGKEVKFSTQIPLGETILAATLNEKGWLAITTKQEGHKGVVSVYNDAYEPVVTIRLSSRYITDAVVSPDCKGLFILSPGQKDGIFETKLLYYKLSDCETPADELSLGSSVSLSVRCEKNRCWILGEDRLSVLTKSAKLYGQYEYGAEYLKKASLGGNGFATLLLSYSQSGGGGTLRTVAADGDVIGSLELKEQVITVTASGRYVAVLTANRLSVYDRNLSEIDMTEDVQGVRDIVLYPDGSLNLIFDERVGLYLPK